jgi:PAS domain S-box-containing protein
MGSDSAYGCFGAEKEKTDHRKQRASINYQIIAESLPDAIVCLDIEGNFLYINDKSEEIFGIDRDDVLGKKTDDLGIAPELFDAIKSGFDKLIYDNLQSLCVEVSYPPGERYYEACLAPEFDQNGDIAATIVILRDITDRTKYEKQLIIQKELAIKTIDTVREPMLILNKNFEVKYANHSFYSCFQLERKNIENKLVYDMDNRRWNIPQLKGLLEDVLPPQGDSFSDLEVNVDIPGRAQRVFRLNARQIDHINLILLAMEDVTERTNLVKSLKESIKDKEDDIYNQAEKLRRLVIELSETEDRERQMLGDMLHDDIQQMLVGVKFHLELAANHCKENEKVQTLLKDAKGLLAEVIQKTRDLSHELSPGTFRRQGLKGGLEWLSRQMLRLHHLEVEIRIDGEIEGIAGQIKLLLYKAIHEMLFNIVKHAKVFHAEVDIVRHKGAVEVRVKDHGDGFDVDEVLNSDSGKGMGLFNIRERLDIFGGELHIQSIPGEGSCFKLTVPWSEHDGD